MLLHTGLSLVAVSGDYFLVSVFSLLVAVSSVVAEHTLGYPGSAVVAPRLSPSSMQNLPGPGIEPTSPKVRVVGSSQREIYE